MTSADICTSMNTIWVYISFILFPFLEFNVVPAMLYLVMIIDGTLITQTPSFVQGPFLGGFIFRMHRILIRQLRVIAHNDRLKIQLRDNLYLLSHFIDYPKNIITM
jgi:hypothetical protein